MHLTRDAAPAPRLRLSTFRVLVGFYATVWAAARLPHHLAQVDRLPERWRPVGVLSWLGEAPADALVVAGAVAAPFLGVAFTLGWRHRLVAPLFAVVLLVVATLDSSWGQVFHTENLIVLHVLILAAAALLPADREDPYGWPLQLAAMVVVVTYVVAGVAKLRIAGWGWLDGDVLRHLVAHDNLRKAVLGDPHSPLGKALVGHRWVFTPMAIASVAVELGAPLALLGGWARTVWVSSAWAFHAGVLALMAVLFAYPLVGVAFAPFFDLERLVPARYRHDSQDAASTPGAPSPLARTP